MSYNKFYKSPLKASYALRMRKDPTEEEKILWSYLRSAQRKNNRFQRQKVILGYIVDFYTHDSRVAIEADGSQHQEENREYDRIRDRALNKSGIYVLRISNEDIRKDIRGVLSRIDAVLVVKNAK